MIFKVKGIDKCFIEADTDLEIVHGLMELLRWEYQPMDLWKQGIQRRCKIDSSADIRIDTNQNFIRDLKNNGYITAITDVDKINRV